VVENAAKTDKTDGMIGPNPEPVATLDVRGSSAFEVAPSGDSPLFIGSMVSMVLTGISIICRLVHVLARQLLIA
jgi:hypothetical protein